MPLSLNAGPTGPPSSVRIPDLGAPPSTVHPSHLADGPTPPTLSAPPPLLFTPGLASPQRTPIRSLFDSPRHRPARLRRRPSVRLSRFRPHHRSPHHHPTPQHARRGVGRCLPPPNPPPPPPVPRRHTHPPRTPWRARPRLASFYQPTAPAGGGNARRLAARQGHLRLAVEAAAAGGTTGQDDTKQARGGVARANQGGTTSPGRWADRRGGGWGGVEVVGGAGSSIYLSSYRIFPRSYPPSCHPPQRIADHLPSPPPPAPATDRTSPPTSLHSGPSELGDLN